MNPSDTALNKALIAVFVCFGLNGLVFASWAARIPAAAQDLGIGAAGVGLLLLFSAIGSVAALPLAGSVAQRIGTAGTVRVGGLTSSAASLAIAAGLHLGSIPLTAAGLLVFGVGIAGWDVAMNLEGADVERRLGRNIMPKFHGAFSAGSFTGALIGAGLSAAGVSLSLHLLAILTVVALVVLIVPRDFLHLPHPAHAEGAGGAPASRFGAWREGRTLLIGVVVLGAALTEGAANDWVAKATVDGLGTSESTGALMFAVFVAAMTLTRWFGARLIDRIGRVPALRICMSAALAGLLLFVLAPNIVLAGIGAVLWGIGAALGFPMGMSAAGEDPLHAAGRVSVVSTIGYMAFFVGPPVLGFLGEHWGVRNALLTVGLAIALSLVFAPAAAERKAVSETA
ncbi:MULTISPECIES: MFS transporter [unclassified Arthrobacter]|uniref:MFS transporter n=1 Tax=unclassified Arthrobacter TaxID=235627 RepID=UPI001D1494FD|nr:MULTISPECIES: MFS transporter [unclassified Arthrobacter]MCC3278660.1 MFS transporter [Arthrobacter sp. zg-Y40]MCC9177027.1 MFS transporter [Arthrobacter sp. zg-Y750]MDK1326262.1 MFS transporter [Arthrobacter sp. zg-Y1143]